MRCFMEIEKLNKKYSLRQTERKRGREKNSHREYVRNYVEFLQVVHGIYRKAINIDQK